MPKTKASGTVAANKYLFDFVVQAAARFKAKGFALPPLDKIKITCGWPSIGGTGARSRRIGEAWHPSASAAGEYHVFINPSQVEISGADGVGGILYHELCHVSNYFMYPDDMKIGHGAKFRQCAKAIGLEGKMTATTAGESLVKEIDKIHAKLGDYPHAKLDFQSGKKQGTRMIKCHCPSPEVECRNDKDKTYTVRTTRAWLEPATPICPVCNIEMIADV